MATSKRRNYGPGIRNSGPYSDFLCLKLREVISEILFKLREVISDFYILLHE